MDSEESEESYSSINDNLCDECYDAVIFHDGGDEFYEGTNRDDEPTLRHSEEGGDIIDLDSVRRWNDTLPDLPMMTESTAAGCRMCGFLREELLRQKICHIGETYIEAGYLFGGQGYEFEIIDTDPGLAFWRCEVYGVKKTTYNPDGFKSITSLTFDIESCDKDLHQWLRVHTKPAPGPLDPASVEWVQSQLQRCDYHCDHGKPELPFIPTRLIYVGQNEDDAPRLVIVENMLDSGMIDALEANCDDEDFDDWMPSEAEVGGTSFPNGYEDIDVCRYCADPMHKRTGYGLVIHPAEEPGSYVRVGVFVMFAHKGGMYLFKDEAEEIKLI
ncbi:hypothetical protein CaCOL14_000116 [Colletotrichum acutatum]